MIKTIKLPISINNSDIDIIKNVQHQYSCIVRGAYNRGKEDVYTQKDIRHLSKELNNIELLDSWLSQCAIMEGKQIHDSYKSTNRDKPLIFGSRKMFYHRYQNKISNEEYTENRLRYIISQGEKSQKGNRKFKLDIINNNQIIFKLNRNTHITLQLPELKPNYQKYLYQLEQLSRQKEIAYTIKLNTEYIHITFDISTEQVYNPIPHRVMAIDQNPEGIGGSVIDIHNRNNVRIISSGVIDLTEYTKNLSVTSDSKEQQYQNNKRKHETIETCKWLINKAEHYKCKKFVIEKLDIQSTGYIKSKNRLINNVGNTNLVKEQIQKRCRYKSIEFVEINPAYSSFVGNLQYNNYPDPINASIEIGRRGYKKYAKQGFYPEFDKEHFMNRWKEEGDWNQIDGGKSLYRHIKNSGVKYRVSGLIDEFDQVFSLNHKQSKIGCLIG